MKKLFLTLLVVIISLACSAEVMPTVTPKPVTLKKIYQVIKFEKFNKLQFIRMLILVGQINTNGNLRMIQIVIIITTIITEVL